MKIISNGSASITIDGRSFSGRNISISGNKVIIDGVVQGGELVGDVNVVVNGDVDAVENTNGKVEVTGSVGQVKTTNGDIRCGDVKGDVTTSNGTVQCGVVHGQVRTTNGNISHR